VDAFFFVEAALLLGPAVAFVLVGRISPKSRKGLTVACGTWLGVLVAGDLLGFRVAPRPLGAIAVSVGLGAFWVIVWSGRPKSDAVWWHKTPYWIGASTVLVLNYFVATVGVLGLGFATESSRPHARVRLTPTVVVYAFRFGGPSLDFSGYEVQVRRTIPVIGLLEHISETRGYARTTADQMTPPTFTLSNREGSVEILVHLGAWAGEAASSPDTIRLD
jgi:hypothetical protein